LQIDNEENGMTRGDFYIGQGPESNWIGSITHDAFPQNIPLDILICINPTLYEELVVEFIEKMNGIIKTNGQGWPWPWHDSKLTDYSYIFEPTVDKVLASHLGEDLFDPIAIVQGEDMNNAITGFGPPIFRNMVKRKTNG
jgi:hypothetical protein